MYIKFLFLGVSRRNGYLKVDMLISIISIFNEKVKILDKTTKDYKNCVNEYIKQQNFRLNQ